MTNINAIIVQSSESANQAVRCMHIHHRNFPEIWAECGTAAEGATRLSTLLARERDWAGDDWHRECIGQAVADVHAYVDAFDRPVERRSVDEDHEVDRDPAAAASPFDRVGNSCPRTLPA